MPLLCVLERDADARIVFVPSDHFVEDEAILEEAMTAALSHVGRRQHDVVLLGIVPDEPDTQFGWIVPGPREGSLVLPVQRFVEKPAEPLAMELMARGGMWNSFIFVSAARTVLDMFERRMPGVVATLCAALAHARPDEALARAYERTECQDFCRDVLQDHEGPLKVLPVAPCGWSDLGTPDRVRRCVTRLGEQAEPGAWSASAPAAMDLAVALAGA
jgi:mannose-1-phosphate guanylyltransferase